MLLVGKNKCKRTLRELNSIFGRVRMDVMLSKISNSLTNVFDDVNDFELNSIILDESVIMYYEFKANRGVNSMLGDNVFLNRMYKLGFIDPIEYFNKK